MREEEEEEKTTFYPLCAEFIINEWSENINLSVLLVLEISIGFKFTSVLEIFISETNLLLIFPVA